MAVGRVGGSVYPEVGAGVRDGGAWFCVWAPKGKVVEVVFDGRAERLRLAALADGFHAGELKGGAAGLRYKYSLDGGEAFPDPASRWQPDGPHGWSEVVAGDYAWAKSESGREGIELRGQVIYEMHVGTFTPEGTYAAAERELKRLADLGITVLEMMPLPEFPGEFGWGYDGVYLFAPYHAYGRPDELRHFIGAAHAVGLAVILDVVYNHFGPDGNYLTKYSDHYMSERATEWGESINFDGADCGAVRAFFTQNAAYWIREFHFDGLRLDATQAIKDDESHGRAILREIVEAARQAAGTRKIIVVSECERQDGRQILPVERGGYGIDGMWNDDFHHSAVVRLTSRREAYYSDHLGRAQEFISAAKHGFLYQGQFYAWQRAPRGTAVLGREPWRFITFLENHDQVANSARSERPRAFASPQRYRAMCGYWLLAPGTPMFFQGQEYGAEEPFHYFADHNEGLARAVREGRAEFLKQFGSIDTDMMKGCMADPEKRATFEKSKLDAGKRELPNEFETMFADLLRLRREDKAIARQAVGGVDGAVLTDECFVLRFFGETEDGSEDRLLVVNFGATYEMEHCPEPLLAPPLGMGWKMKWASDDPRYGGCGIAFPLSQAGWQIGGEMAMLLEPFHGANEHKEAKTGKVEGR